MSRTVCGKRELCSGRWIRLVEISYSDDIKDDGVKQPKRLWEAVERTTKVNDSTADGIKTVLIYNNPI